MIQDEVQGFHWNNSQSTLHPIVTYYQENDELKSISHCVIFDDRKHVALVYEVQKTILADLKCKLQLLFILLMGVLDSTKIRKKFIIFVSTKLIVCSYHVTYAFQSESTLYSSLNVKNSLLEADMKSEV